MQKNRKNLAKTHCLECNLMQSSSLLSLGIWRKYVVTAHTHHNNTRGKRGNPNKQVWWRWNKQNIPNIPKHTLKPEWTKTVLWFISHRHWNFQVDEAWHCTYQWSRTTTLRFYHTATYGEKHICKGLKHFYWERSSGWKCWLLLKNKISNLKSKSTKTAWNTACGRAFP